MSNVTEDMLTVLWMHCKKAGASKNVVCKDLARVDPSRTESSFEHQFRGIAKKADDWIKNGVPDAKAGGARVKGDDATVATPKGVKRGRGKAEGSTTTNKRATKKAKTAKESNADVSPTPAAKRTGSGIKGEPEADITNPFDFEDVPEVKEKGDGDADDDGLDEFGNMKEPGSFEIDGFNF